MRLLDTTTLEVISFLADTIPAYAILSHTWGTEQDEPTLQQLQELTLAGRRDASAWTRHPVALKKGYVKLRAACSLALSQSYRYIWIDTCCIDKTSSAELSEAVNSMYRWYEGAGICYVFLEDVDVGPGIMNPDISRCRWFTRGWTLQELVAPANVVFYDYKWSYIGSKRDRPDFREQLSRTTGVDSRVLNGDMSIDELSVACRMAWAAKRTTTRPEDIAYCLMGIFQANMPLLYGEGSRAFIRLQEEILRSHDDHSLFAWKYPKGDSMSSQLSGLLASSPRHFQETSHVVASVPDVSRPSAPSSLTNAGLHVQFRLRPIHANSAGSHLGLHAVADLDGDTHTDYVAILNCAPFTDSDKREYFHGLRLVALGSGQFARIRNDTLLKIDCSTIELWKDQRPSKGLRYLYVKQKPTWVFPEIRLEELEVATKALQWSLVEVHPTSRWDRRSRTLRSGHSQFGKVLGGFRFKISRTAQADAKFSYFDVFVLVDQIEGQLGNWFAIPVCYDVQMGCTLQQSCIKMSKEDCSELMMPSAMWNQQVHILRHGLATLLVKTKQEDRVSFHLRMHESEGIWVEELDGKEVFGSGRIHTAANLLRNRAEMDHLVALTRRLACEVVEDTIDLTFRQSVNIVRELPSKIRMSGSDSHALLDFRKLLEEIRQYAPGIQVTGENGDKLGVLEQYFANRLAVACIHGDIATARELLQTKLVTVSHEAKVSGQSFADKDLCTAFLAFRPIHWAAVFGHTEIVRLLTENGADPYSKTVTGFTTMHLAAAMGHGELVAHLLGTWKQREVLASTQLRRGRLEEPPGHLAAAYDVAGTAIYIKKPAMIDWILPEMSIHNGRNGLGETALHRAAAMNNADAISALGAALEPNVPYYLAIGDGYGRAPLWHAAATGANEAISLLLSFSAEADRPDVYGRTPLHIACREGRPTAVKLLLDAGADVNLLTTAPCLSACHFAALAADIECLRLVIEFGGKADLCQTEGLELGAIHIAAANGWLEGVKLLVEKGCDPNTPCSHLVMARGHSQTGSGVNVARFQFRNAAEVAVRGGHEDVVEFLNGL